MAPWIPAGLVRRPEPRRPARYIKRSSSCASKLWIACCLLPWIRLSVAFATGLPRLLPKGEFDLARGKLGCRRWQRNGFATSRDWNAVGGGSNASKIFLRQSQRRRKLLHPFVRALNECSPPSAACRLARNVRLLVSSVPSRINTE